MGFFCLSACSSSDDAAARRLNDMACDAIEVRDYPLAQALVDSVSLVTGNEVELLTADVYRMVVCERMSRNREYHEARERAILRMERIAEERASLDSTNEARMVAAEQAFAAVDSAYYNYIGLKEDYSDVPFLVEAGEFLNCGDYVGAIVLLEETLEDGNIGQEPRLVAAIHERLSVAYSALDDKPSSDYHRNAYLNLQESTRQDRYMEARAEQLDALNAQLSAFAVAIVVAIILLVLSLLLFHHLDRRRHGAQLVATPVDADLEERLEELGEELRELKRQVTDAQRVTLQERCKVSLSMAVIPLIDRMVAEVRKGDGRDETYLEALAKRISELNDMLTEWIKMSGGALDLHVETFALQNLFDIIVRSRSSFARFGVTLSVEATSLSVKADRTLTLFMLNTIADNARKFTPEGGSVMVSAKSVVTDDGRDYVEVSVSDTGCGLSDTDQQAIFERKIYDGHGFGLMNCRGIIEKYRKTSSLFAGCTIDVESRVGEGSRFFFRLPAGVRRAVMAMVIALASILPITAQEPIIEVSNIAKAQSFADSAYFSNIAGTYDRTLSFADSCWYYLNAHYCDRYGSADEYGDELSWLRDSVVTNYGIIADIRNETAVAALALHDWALYEHNNRMYTALIHELAKDNSLDDYCRAMERSQSDKVIAIILLIIIFLAMLPAYYVLYYRHHLRFKRHQAAQAAQARSEKEVEVMMAADECRRVRLELDNLRVTAAVTANCLSTLKHETMYYPNRILSTLRSDDLEEVVSYYSTIYTLLCTQALRQSEREHIRVSAVPMSAVLRSYEGSEVLLGDANLLSFLFELAGDVASVRAEEEYIIIDVRSAMDAYSLFLCRQIIRDHSDATGRRASGITRLSSSEGDAYRITLPRAI